MGYHFDLVCKALHAIRESSNKKKAYNPVGEVQKAIDWINDLNQKQEDDLMK